MAESADDLAAAFAGIGAAKLSLASRREKSLAEEVAEEFGEFAHFAEDNRSAHRDDAVGESIVYADPERREVRWRADSERRRRK